MADITYSIQVALGGTLVDVRGDRVRIRGFSCSYGRDRQFESFTTGRCTFTIKDLTGDYVPNGGGVWSDETWVGREVVVRATARGLSNVVWRGHVEDIDVRLVDKNHSEITVDAVDPLAKLGRTFIDDNTVFSSELSSTRLSNVLALAEVSDGYFDADTKDIATGEMTLQAEADAGSNTLSYLQAVERSESGLLFIANGGDVGGRLTFRPRSFTSVDSSVSFRNDTAWDGDLLFGGTAATTSFDSTVGGGDATTTTFDATFGSSVGDATYAETYEEKYSTGDAGDRLEVAFQTINLEFGSESLVNRVTFTRDGGTPQTVEDVAEQGRYGIRPVSQGGFLNATDGDVSDLALARLGKFSLPQQYVDRVGVQLAGLTDAQAAVVLGLTVGSRVVVATDTPGGTGSILSTVRVEQVRHDVSLSSHLVTFGMSKLSDEFATLIDGGDAASASFDTTWDGGTAATSDAAFAESGPGLNGGTAVFG